jgi:hypothetical protein
MKYVLRRFNGFAVLMLLLALGCKEQKMAGAQKGEGVAVISPANAVVLLKDKKPTEEPFCLNAIGSDGKKLTVGRLSRSQAQHEAGRFYFGVLDSDTEITGQRRLALKRTFFTDPAGAVKAATEIGASQFQECPKFAGM